MNDDERFLRDWLDDDAPDPGGARKDADQIMARLPETKQRSRWWPLLPVRRSGPRSSSDGQPPTVNGRTRFMFSPAKTITAGLVVVALGGAFLVARPISQQPSMPGAETEAIAPTWVTGDVNAAAVPCTADPDVVDGDVLRSRNVECNPQIWTSSDPRLTGTVARRWNDDVYQTDESTISVSKAGAYMRNEGGGWACSASDLLTGSGKATEALTGTTFECVGNGGYAGLSAMLVLEPTVGFNEEFVGLIFSGDFPPPPEAPPVE